MQWDELVEIAAKASWQAGVPDGVLPWEGLPEVEKGFEREDADAALRALIAAGYAIVPREPTPDMLSDAESAGCCPRHWWLAALSAGEIKPEEPTGPRLTPPGEG